MTDYIKVLGKFPTITAPATSTDVAKSFYQAVLKQKDKLVEESNFDTEDNPFFMFESLKQSLNPRKGDDKYTYHGIRKVKDKETNISTEEEADLPMKKFITVTAEAKIVFKFFLCALMKQSKDYFSSRGSKFPEENKLMEELAKYSKNTAGYPVIPFIVKASEIFNVNYHIRGGYNSIEKKLREKAGPFFKDSEDKIPDTHLGIIVEHYVKFLHVLALFTGSMLFPARRAVNLQLLLGFIYQINVMVEEHGSKLSNDTIVYLKEYVNACKPEKKTKEDSEEKDDADESDEDVTEKKHKKTPAKKTSTTGKTRGRPPRKPKPTPAAEDEEDINGGDSIDNAMENLGGDEWEDGADISDD
jgi:hypothetical protein